MSIQLSGQDIIDLAVQIERRGEQFYRQSAAAGRAAEAASDAAARALFDGLADDEARHRALFESLAPGAVMVAGDPAAWEDAAGYIEATVDQALFRKDAAIRAVPLAEDIPGMLRQAIIFEQETILYLYTLRDLVVASSRPLVDRILAEERGHVRRLASRLRHASAL